MRGIPSRRPKKDSLSSGFLHVISNEFFEFGLSSAQKVAQLSKDLENREWWKRTDIELKLPFFKLFGRKEEKVRQPLRLFFG